MLISVPLLINFNSVVNANGNLSQIHDDGQRARERSLSSIREVSVESLGEVSTPLLPENRVPSESLLTIISI